MALNQKGQEWAEIPGQVGPWAAHQGDHVSSQAGAKTQYEVDTLNINSTPY